MNRRHFLQTAVALPFAAKAFALAAPDAPRHVLLGTDAGKGIYRATWNPATGAIGAPELAIAADRPDFFAQHPTQPILYSVNSVGNGKGAISSFRLDAKTAHLTFLHKASTHGDGPCFVSVDRTGHVAFAANYPSGNFAAFFLDDSGQMTDAGGFSCAGDACGPVGPVKDRQDNSHLHCATIAPANDFVLVCDLGKDAIEIAAFHPRANGSLPRTRIATRSGSGPRHVAFHPNGRWFYCIHELDATIDLYDWSVTGGKPTATLRKESVISSLAPHTPLPGNTACEILVSPDGRFAYACNRGVNDIVVYRIDAHTGLLTEQQRLGSGGPIPRIIAFDPSRRWLVACNQGAQPNPVGNLAVFAHDPATGHLTFSHNSTADTPMFIHWV